MLFFLAKAYPIALALGNIAQFAFEGLIAARAMFIFVLAHTYQLNVTPLLIKKGMAL